MKEQLKNFYNLSKYSLENINWIDDLPKQVIGCTIKAETKGKWNKVMIIFNASQNDIKVKIDGEDVMWVN